MNKSVQTVHIRTFHPSDWGQIDAIRRPHYGGFEPLTDPNVQYMVAERAGQITALYGYKMDGGTRALIVDFFGTNARDWEDLCEYLLRWADQRGIELSAWCSLSNKNVHWFENKGFSRQLVLLRRSSRMN